MSRFPGFCRRCGHRLDPFLVGGLHPSCYPDPDDRFPKCTGCTRPLKDVRSVEWGKCRSCRTACDYGCPPPSTQYPCGDRCTAHSPRPDRRSATP